MPSAGHLKLMDDVCIDTTQNSIIIPIETVERAERFAKFVALEQRLLRRLESEYGTPEDMLRKLKR
jgi:hypothetical protein